MEREIKQLTTPLNKILKLYTYITAREARELKAIYINDMPLSMTGGETETRITPATMEKAENRLLEMVVVEYDSITEKQQIIEGLQNLPAQEWQYVLDQCTRIKDSKDFLV